MSTKIAINGNNAEQFDPIGTGNSAAIIIAYGSEGMTNDLSGPWATMIREFAVKLASDGFTVLIPDYLGATNTRPGAGVSSLIHTHGGRWQQTIADAMAYARSQPGIGPERVGLLGFSLGGHLCLRLRATTKALVEFYAPAYGLSPLSTKLALHVQIHHGKDDHLLPFGQNAAIIDSMLLREGVVTDLRAYPGAKHGFIGSDKHNTKARAESLERSLAFFDEHL
jgi:dienelactone hydrolase